MNRVAILFLAFFQFNSWAASDYSLDLIPDHAPLAAGHVAVADDYMERQLKVDGQYDIFKINQFIERLKKEKISLAEDVYETVLLEKLEIEIASFKKAKKSALKKIKDDKKGILAGYTLYLLPHMEKLLEKVTSGAAESQCDALVDAFVIIYSTYYMPEYKRNFLPSDFNPLYNLKSVTMGWSFKKDDRNQLQANNLGVSSDHQEEVAACLGKSMLRGHALTNEEIKQLISCDFDLSKLDPVKSALWSNRTIKQYQAMQLKRDDFFPQVEEDVYFSKVKFSSAGSAKLTVYIKRKNKEGKEKKIKYKLKFGREVHNELATTALASMIGMHTDPVKYVKKVKLFLGDTTCDKFIKQYTRRYGGTIKFIENIMVEKCDDKKNYLVLRDALFERKHPDKIRLESFSIDSWDFPNKREFRGLLTWYNWVNLGDAKPENHVINLVKKGDEYLPELMLQDLGYSLKINEAYTLKHALNRLKYSAHGRIVNAFGKSAMKWNNKKVKFFWADITNAEKKFTSTTYSDVKWMARKIARIPREGIEHAFKIAGLNEDSAHLYTLKVINRRNELVKAFELEEEFQIYTIPDLDTYSPNENIENGKIIKASYEGETRYQAPRASLWPNILSYLVRTFSINKIRSDFSVQIGSELEVTAKKQAPIWNNESGTGKNMIKTIVLGGVRLTLNRFVGTNGQYIAQDGQTSAFFIRDTVKIELYIGGELIKEIGLALPISIRADLTAYGKEFEFVHFSSSWAKAYIKPFNLLHIIQNYKNYVLDDLKPNEVIKVADSYGFNIGLEFRDQLMPFISSGSVGASIEWRKSSSTYLYRDTYGELHAYKGKDKRILKGMHFNLAQVDLLISALPILGMDYTRSRFRHRGELFTFKIPGSTLQQHTERTVISQRHRELERRAFLAFLEHGENSMNAMARRDLSINADSVQTAGQLRMFFFETRRATKGYAKTVVKIKDRNTKTFHRSFYTNIKMKGFDFTKMSFLNGLISGATIKNKKFHSIQIEMDEEKPEEGMGIVYIQRYDRTKTKEALLEEIEYLNENFSENKGKNFFRNYILPDKELVPKYKKVASQIRIYINGKAFFNKFMNMSEEDINDTLSAFSKDDRKMRPFRLRRLKRKLIGYKKKMYKVKPGKKMVKLMSKIIRSLQPEKYGTLLFKRIFGANNFFIMGEIYGVHPSFTRMQARERTAERRFAGKSWGSHTQTPPIRKFMNNNLMGPLSQFVRIGIQSDVLFGEDAPVMPIGVPL